MWRADLGWYNDRGLCADWCECIFTNDKYPRAKNLNWVLENTLIKNGASI